MSEKACLQILVQDCEYTCKHNAEFRPNFALLSPNYFFPIPWDFFDHSTSVRCGLIIII